MKLRMYLRGLGLGMVLTALVLTFGLKSDNNKMTDAEIRAKAKELGMVDEATTLKEASAKEESVKEAETEVKPLEQAEVKPEEQAETKPAEQAEAKPEEPATEEKAEAPTDDKTVEEAKTEEVKDDKAENTEKTEKTEKTEEELEAEKEAVKKEAEEAAKKAAEEAEKLKAEEEAAKKEAEENAKKASGTYSLKIEKGYSSDRVAKILEGAGVVSSASSFDKYLCSNGYDHRISVGTYQIPAGADYATIAKLITHSN